MGNKQISGINNSYIICYSLFYYFSSYKTYPYQADLVPPVEENMAIFMDDLELCDYF